MRQELQPWKTKVLKQTESELPEGSIDTITDAGLYGGGLADQRSTFGFENGIQNSHGGPGWHRFRERGSGVKFIEGNVEPLSEAESSFAPGDRCFHQKFGMGNVRTVDRDKLTIDFDKAGEKRVVAAFVMKP